MIMLPSHPDFYHILHTAKPPGWQNYNRVDGEVAFVVDAETKILRPASRNEFFEYALGGEYDEVVGEDADF